MPLNFSAEKGSHLSVVPDNPTKGKFPYTERILMTASDSKQQFEIILTHEAKGGKVTAYKDTHESLPWEVIFSNEIITVSNDICYPPHAINAIFTIIGTSIEE